ncbi:MAG: hypothetical protein IKC14_04665, partial [Kiritimatiellae bacterium]|nr:hypothetical protein [Kiritimatiellia bacterium]
GRTSAVVIALLLAALGYAAVTFTGVFTPSEPPDAVTAEQTAAETAADGPPAADAGRSTQALTNEQNESANEHSEQKEQSMNANTRSSILSAALAATMAAAPVLAAQAEPGAIEVVAGNYGTGEFTLRVPASEKPLELYWAAAWADDTDEYAQWRDPVFLTDVAAGTTEVAVTVPSFKADVASRFFLADPANATVTRHEYHTGGKDGSGYYKSAFITGLHPNWDWSYELVFDVAEFAKHSWVLCHRKNNSNSGGSLLHFIVRDSTDKRLRFGYAATQGVYSLNTQVAVGVKYQATIDKNVFTVSNLTDNVSFYTVALTASTDDYETGYNLWFGASGGNNGKDYNSNDGCSFVRVHSFKAWNGSNELVGDFRPIVTNGVAGYFDLATRKFFASGDQSLGAAGTSVASGFEPYVASETTLHIDTLVAHLGDLIAVSTALKAGPVECVSESIQFINDSLPNYGALNIAVGDSVTFSVPTEKFLWTDTANKTFYRVRSAGLRIDAYDAVNEVFVTGTPQPGLRNYTFTRQSASDGVRVVCLWDAEMLVDPPNGLRAECLRLVSVGTNPDSGKTEVGHGLFNTGVHPIPSATRVLLDVSIDNNNRGTQASASPVGELRFFGVRDVSRSAPDRYADSFLVDRLWTGSTKYLCVNMCNYVDGATQNNGQISMGNKELARFQIDVNPTFTRVFDATEGVEHLAELKGYERSSEPLNGTLHTFGQHRPDDATAPLCVDYKNTRYYSYTIWTNGVDLTRDYVPCLDAAGRPAFYDRVAGNYIYPIGDKAEIVAEFGSYAVTNSVQVTGENENGEPAAYLDPDATALGYHQIAVGNSETFTATGRFVFGRRVVGYRVDTWDEAAGWQKGAVQSARSVTLNGEDTIRRLVWIWDSATGFVFYLK